MAFAASMVAACARYGQNPPATPAQEQITPEQLTRSGLRFDVCFLATALRRDEKALQTMLQRPLFLTVLPYRSDRRDRLSAQQQVRPALINPAVIPHSAQNLAAALNLSPAGCIASCGKKACPCRSSKTACAATKRVTCCCQPNRSNRWRQQADSGTTKASAVRF